MKKIVALVLALALALTAVAAFAAGSPEGPGGKVTPAGGGGTGTNTGTDTGTVTPADTEGETEATSEEVELAKELAKTAEVAEAVASDSADSAAIKESLVAAAKDDVLSVLPEEIQEELKQEELTVVNEMVTVKFPKDPKSLTFKMTFQTPYKAGEKVAVLIAIPGKDGIEWISVEGISIGEGEVVFTFVDEATYNKVADQEVVVVPASAK